MGAGHEQLPSYRDGIDVTDEFIEYLRIDNKEGEVPFYFSRQSHPASVTLNYKPIVAKTTKMKTTVGDSKNLEFNKLKEEIQERCEEIKDPKYLTIVSIYMVYIYEDRYYMRLSYSKIKKLEDAITVNDLNELITKYKQDLQDINIALSNRNNLTQSGYSVANSKYSLYTEFIKDLQSLRDKLI